MTYSSVTHTAEVAYRDVEGDFDSESGASREDVVRPYFGHSVPILARNPKTSLKNREYCPFLRELLEKRAKIGTFAENRDGSVSYWLLNITTIK